MKPLVGFSKSKKSQRYSKTMPKGPVTNKSNMCKIFNLKKFMES